METMSLARVEEDITRHRLALSKLYAYKNSFSCTFRLPTETLADIFICCARDYYRLDGYDDSIQPTWINFSYVCGHWRNVALNCPALWSYIARMPRRWLEELLIRSKKVPLKISIFVPFKSDGFSAMLEKVRNHVERIQELNLRVVDRYSVQEFLSKLTLRAPLLQYLKISAGPTSPDMSVVLFDGDTPALRTLELLGCPVPWFSLKLSGLTTLALHHGSLRFQQNMEKFLVTLGCMQDLSHLYLTHVLPRSQGLTSSTAFNSLQKINLPRLSRLQIDDTLSMVIAFLSCVNIPSDTEVRLGCYAEGDTSVDHYTLLSSVLVHRLSAANPTIRSLVLQFNRGLLTFSASERDHKSYDNYTTYADWGSNIPLQILCRSRLDDEQIVSDICNFVPLTNVQSLYVIDPPTSLVFWKRVLGHLRDLRYLKLSWGYMPDLVSILSLTPQDSVENLAGYADGGSNPIFVPALEELELRGMSFTAEWHLRAGLPSLKDALAIRKDHQVRLKIFDCVECSDPEDTEEEEEESDLSLSS